MSLANNDQAVKNIVSLLYELQQLPQHIDTDETLELKSKINNLKNQIHKKKKKGADTNSLETEKKTLETRLIELGGDFDALEYDKTKERIKTEFIKNGAMRNIFILTDEFDASNPDNTDFLASTLHFIDPSHTIDYYRHELKTTVELYARALKYKYDQKQRQGKKTTIDKEPEPEIKIPMLIKPERKKQNFDGLSTVEDFDDGIHIMKSSDLLKECGGISSEQKRDSCLMDSVMEILLNADTIGEITRSEIFEYGVYKTKTVPFKVKPDVIKKDDLHSFVVYIIFNYILLNLEITNDEKFMEIIEDKIMLERQHSYDRCGYAMDFFYKSIQDIFIPANKSNDKIASIITSIRYDYWFAHSDNPKDIDINKYSTIHPIFLLNGILKYIPHSLEHVIINYYTDFEFYNAGLKYETFDKIKLKNDNFVASLLINYTYRLDVDVPQKTVTHATSIIKCNDKFLLYDDNKKINPKTRQRSIELNEDLLFKEQLNYLKTFNDKIYVYTKDRPISEIFASVIVFNKIKPYSKDIILKKIDGPSLKKILLDMFIITYEEIITTQFDEKYHNLLRHLVNVFMIYLDLKKYMPKTPLQIQQEKLIKEHRARAYNKYLKYKYKYLSLSKKYNIQ